MKRILIIIFSFVFFISSCVTGRDETVKPVGKTDHKIETKVSGKSVLPFWSELTGFEIQTMKNLDKARKGDPNALLALAVMASGNKRDFTVYNKIEKRIRHFVDQLRPEIAKTKTFREKGNVLHQAMHKEFFLKSRGSNPAGYSLNQSRLTEIFTTQKYNCISSAMLYMILARYYNFNVNGVLLPTHAFIQIESPEGTIIEVETTSITGYGWIHNKKFYKKQAVGWFKFRGLRSSTYKDYQNRRIVAPHLLIAADMNLQHTTPERMNSLDRLRMSEIFAYTDPNNRTAQLNMLIAYNDQFNRYKSKKDFKTLERLFGRTDSLITWLRKNWKNDYEIQNMIAWLDYEYAYTLHHVGKHDRALKRQKADLPRLGKNMKDRDVLLENQVSLVHNYMIKLVEQKRFKNTEVISQRFSGYCNQIDWCRADQGWFYNPWATVYWDKKEWDKVTEKLGLQLKLTQDKKIRTDVLKNLENGYLNWCYTYMNQGSWSRAANILKECLANYPEMNRCKKVLKKLKDEHGV